MSGIMLSGLCAESPMAFLAALGALALASDGHDKQVTLSWRAGPDGSLRPLLHSSQLDTRERMVEAVIAGHETRDLERELGWEKDLMRVSREELRKLLRDRLDAKSDSGDARAAWMLAACLCELPLRRLQQASASAVSYTPFRLIPRVGRARFLEAARRECEAGVEHLHGCLFEPWQYQRGTQSLRWDPGAAVPARALMAQAPTHVGPSGVPGAVLLAVRGLAFFQLITTRVGRTERAAPPGISKQREFVWPIWSDPLSERGTRMMLSMPWPMALVEARNQELKETAHDARGAARRKIGEKFARRQLRAHGVIACYAAPRVRRGDDDEAFGWGQAIPI
ncbi:MAG TPA: hypothetical protein VNV42_03660 [Solirubrobacteraceae bacterium]|nr:hypothetical protein [Solirubrobacteraceae bacterium]